MSQHHRHRGFPWYTVLDVGKQFPDVSIEHSGRRTSLHSLLGGHWTILVYLSNPDLIDTHFPSYLRQQLGSDTLQFLCVLSSQAVPPRQADGKPIDAILFLRDPDDSFRRVLGIPANVPNPVWSFLVDPLRFVHFSIPSLIAPDSMRQLAERFLLGKISYAPKANLLYRQVALDAATRGFSQMALLTHLPDSHSLSLQDVQRKWTHIIFFAKSCVVCGQTSRFQELMQVVSAGYDLTKNRVLVVFSATYSKAALLKDPLASRFLEISYIATSIAPWESPYSRDSDQNDQSLVFTFSRDGSLAKLSSFNEWLLNADGAK